MRLAKHYNYFRDYDPATGRYDESDPIGLRGGLNAYAYAALHPLGLQDPFGLQVPLGLQTLGRMAEQAQREAQFRELWRQRNPESCACTRWPDFITFQIDIWVWSTSGTFTRHGDVFWGNGANRQYPNAGSRGVSISDGWLLKCDPTQADINNFLAGYSAGASAYFYFGGSYSANPAGQAITLGVGFGGGAVTPAMINDHRGNILGNPQ